MEKKIKNIEGGYMVDTVVDCLMGCCNIEYIEEKPIITYRGKEIERIIKKEKEKYIQDLMEKGVITFWGKDFDNVETLSVTFKGDIARFYYEELSKLTTK